MRNSIRRLPYAMVAVLFALGVFALLRTPGAGGNGSRGGEGAGASVLSRGNPGQPLPTFGQAPFPGAVSISMSEAAKLLPYVPLLPQTDLASDKTISSVWVR